MSKELSINQVWPKELLYFRRMGSTEISQYLEITPPEKRLILISWGVLEAHGPYLPVATDSMMAQVATDKVADKLYKNHKIQPIIFNSFADIGSYSATRDFPGAVAIEKWQEYQPPQIVPNQDKLSPILHMWNETIGRLKREGFDKFFLVNGDGGNWMNYFERPWQEDFRSIKIDLEKKHSVKIEGSNWDQDGGVPLKHGGDVEHAFINWLVNSSPDFERMAAIRAGIKAVPEEKLKELDGSSFGNLEDEERRRSNWAQYPGQDKLRGVTEFSLEKYHEFANGAIETDFEAKIEKLMEKVLNLLNRKV